MGLLVAFLEGLFAGFLLSLLLAYYFFSKKPEKSIDRDVIKSISIDVLKEASEQNLKITEGVLKTVSSNTASIFDEKKAEINSIISPLREQLGEYREQLLNIENLRREDYGNIRKFLDTIENTTARIREETVSLNEMLKNSQLRGQWGELTLMKIVENAGMAEHIDYDQQVQITGGERPDMVIHLPGSKEVVVDSKAPYKKFIESYEEKDTDKKGEKLKEFAEDLKKQIKSLGSKQYNVKIPGSFQFTVMFLPHESMLNGAIGADPHIVDYAISNQIVIATPLTFFALLKVIHLSWKEESMLKNSGELIKIAGQINERMGGMYERLDKIGRNLNSLVRDYNSLISFSEGRVLPSLKKMNQIGELGMNDTDAGREIEELPREPLSEKWNSDEKSH